MRITTLFFDLDDTLYPSSTGLWNAIRDRMGQYMHDRLNIPWEDIPRIRIQYLETYGTTLRGLQHFYEVDIEEYLAFVHDLPLEEYLYPEPAVRTMLLSLPQKKWIFTNADEAHALRVLQVLRLSDCFEGVIDVHAFNFLCKPETGTYLRALEIAGEKDPSRCVLVDDSPRNLAPAYQLGFTTVLIRNHTSSIANSKETVAKYTITHPCELQQVLPELWEEAGHS